MKPYLRSGLFLLSLLALLLSGCTQAPPAATGSGEHGSSGSFTCLIVDGAGTESLLLAEGEDGLYGGSGVYLLGTASLDNPDTLKDGMTVTVSFDGTVLETYPLQFSQATAVTPTGDVADDRCGLYLQVLEDLWEGNAGLRSEITDIGLDLSGLTDLSSSQQDALAYAFGTRHGILPLTGTWEELAEQGYIDRENLVWKDGVFFSLSGSVEDTFSAQIWRSGLGAYFFLDCTAQMGETGSWTYTVGSEAIS